jgi:hypothetical protein
VREREKEKKKGDESVRNGKGEKENLKRNTVVSEVTDVLRFSVNE